MPVVDDDPDITILLIPVPDVNDGGRLDASIRMSHSRFWGSSGAVTTVGVPNRHT
jgi:hypothetical protein